MSDIEEPPTKMSRYEDLQYLEEVEDCMEEGQEEWLSEGVLTDDDYNPAADPDNSGSNYTLSQEDHNNVNSTQEEIEDQTVDQSFEQIDQTFDQTVDEALDQSMDQTDEKSVDQTVDQSVEQSQDQSVDQTLDQSQDEISEQSQDQSVVQTLEQTFDESMSQSVEESVNEQEQNIEEKLNSMDIEKNDLPDDLDAFLIRKSSNKVTEENITAKSNDNAKQDQDDGNDTDDLLRMLGGEERKSKKKLMKTVKTKQSENNFSSDDDDDDDEFIYEQSRVKTLKVAKNALIRRAPALKAVPEDLSDLEDEPQQKARPLKPGNSVPIRRAIALKKKKEDNSDGSSDEGDTMKRMFEMSRMAAQKRQEESKKKAGVVKHVVHLNRSENKDKSVTKSEPPKQNYTPKSILKTTAKKVESKPTKTVEIKTPEPFKPLGKTLKLKTEDMDMDEIIDEEEFLDEDEFDLHEEEFEDSEGETSRQRIMRPEQMDEECTLDDSHSEDGSLYDELPSSDSEDNEEWFALDIRAERAGDYLPLLGSKAKELLFGEQRRAQAKVTELRYSLSTLTASARAQAEQLRAAAMTLAELDDTLRAA